MSKTAKIISAITAAVLVITVALAAIFLPRIQTADAAVSAGGSRVDRAFSYDESLNGKSVIYYGDSITARYVNENHCETTVTPHYTQLLAGEFGFYFANYARSSAVWGGNGNSLVTQIDGSKTLLASADCVSIFLGTNDYGINRTLGNIASPASENTIYGAIKLTLDKILEINPSVKIMLLTPIARYDGNYGMDKNNNAGYKLSAVVEAVKTVGARYGCAVADLSELVTDANKAEYIQGDNIHVTSKGYAAIADALKKI